MPRQGRPWCLPIQQCACLPVLVGTTPWYLSGTCLGIFPGPCCNRELHCSKTFPWRSTGRHCSSTWLRVLLWCRKDPDAFLYSSTTARWFPSENSFMPSSFLLDASLMCSDGNTNQSFPNNAIRILDDRQNNKWHMTVPHASCNHARWLPIHQPCIVGEQGDECKDALHNGVGVQWRNGTREREE